MNNSHTHIAIIGCGQLGSRHLQGLKNIDREVDVSVVDPDPAARETAEKRFHGMLPEDTLVQSVKYLEDINQLPKHIDVAIIATNADIRRKIIEQTVDHSDVDNMIIEKVVFQSIDDFVPVIERLERKNINSWVNCTRRMYPIYREIKKKLEGQQRIAFQVCGKNWGMGCNSIHHIDLFAYLTGVSSIKLDEFGMDKEIYKSKRKGFVEFGGQLTGKSSRGDSISLIDYKAEGGIATAVHIVCDKYEFLINEQDKLILESKKEHDWKTEKSDFTNPFQSELTYIAVQQILDEGACDLTTLEESYALHQPMLEAFNNILVLSGKDYNGICPIS